VIGGLSGVVFGGAMTGAPVPGPDLDSHVRYMSGLLLGIGLAYWVSVPAVERHTERMRLLTAIIVVGGLARLAGFALHGVPGLPMRLALLMELGVAPALCLWQARVAANPTRDRERLPVTSKGAPR